MESKEIFFILAVYAILVTLLFRISSIASDEGTYSLLGLFYRDIIKFTLQNGPPRVFDFALDYLVHYPKLTIYYPPLYHLLIALGYFFTTSELVGRVITLLFSLGTLLLTYKIGNFLFNKNVGLVSAILLAVTPVFLNLSRMILMDIPLFFFFMLSLWFGLVALKTNKKIHFILFGLSLALGFLVKFPAVLSVPILFVYILVQKNSFKNKLLTYKKFLPPLLLSLIIVLPYLLFAFKLGILQLFFKGAYLAGIAENDPQWYTFSGWLFYLQLLFYQMAFPLTILSLFFLTGFLWKRKRHWGFLLIWVLIIYFVFTLSVNKNERYTILYLPPLLYPISVFIIDSFKKNKKFISMIFIVLVVVQFVLAYSSLPKLDYPIEEVAEYVFNNSKGNVAFVSETGDFFTASFMYHFVKLDESRTKLIYRPCVFYNITEEEANKIVDENGIEYLIVVKNGYGSEQIDKIKDARLEKSFGSVDVYKYNGFVMQPIKKCNYICLTQETICSPFSE